MECTSEAEREGKRDRGRKLGEVGGQEWNQGETWVRWFARVKCEADCGRGGRIVKARERENAPGSGGWLVVEYGARNIW